MPDRDSVINDLNVAKRILCNPQMLTPAMCIRIGQAITSALSLLKEQELVPVYEDKISKCACGNTVNRYWHPKFCGYCGKELMWY